MTEPNQTNGRPWRWLGALATIGIGVGYLAHREGVKNAVQKTENKHKAEQRRAEQNHRKDESAA